MMSPTHVGGCCGPVESDAPIAVTINPEARVSVVRTKTPVGNPKPGEWHTIPITVINQGFVTGVLSIEADPVRGIQFDLPVNGLTGEPLQDAAFRVRLEASAVDITLTFRATAALGGLANHSTLHFLVRSDSPEQPDTVDARATDRVDARSGSFLDHQLAGFGD